MTQSETILNHFLAGKSLTVAEALTQYGVYALSQRVGELKAKHPIQSEWVEQNGKRFKRYFLEAPTELQFKA